MLKWLRSKGKILSLGALVALALQLALSFGHFHHERDTHREDISHSSSSHADGDHDADHKHQPCAICVAVAFNNAPLVAPPSLSHPIAVETALVELPAPSAPHPRLRLTGFQSRAPPQA